MSAEAQLARFVCPVPWCEGRTWTHGGDAAGPDDWLHESAGVELAGGLLILQRWATGAQLDRWTLRTAASSEIAEASTPAELAALLDAASSQLREIGSTAP